MYDVTYGAVFAGAPTSRIMTARAVSFEERQFSRGKVAAVLVSLILGATTTAGAVTIHHKSAAVGFTSYAASSSDKLVGLAAFEDALY